MSAQAHKAGKSGGFKGLLDYSMDKKEASLLASNCGSTKDEILRDMERTSRLRADIKNKVGHISFSLPPSTKIDDKKWIEIMDFAREKIGLDDSFSYASIRHQDRDHDHVHLVFSRVSDNSEVFDDSFIGLHLASVEDLIEDKFGLPLAPKPESPLPPIKKAEGEKALRTGIQPERMRLFSAVHAAAEGNPTAVQFVQKCAQAGVVVRPNLASTGKLNGFSFSLQNSEIEFKGSQLKASWSDLQKKGVHYEQVRDFEALASLAAAVSSGRRSIEPVAASAGKMESAQLEAIRTTETTERDDHARSQDRNEPKTADRPVNERSAQEPEPRPMGAAMRRYLDRIAADSQHRAFLADVRSKLAQIGEKHPAAARFFSYIDESKTCAQIAAAFLANENCSADARALIGVLNLTPREEAEVLSPYRAQIQTEEYNRRRWAEAEKNAPTPDANPSALPTFGG